MDGCSRQVSARNRPRTGGMVCSPARMWAKAETSVPSGWLPCVGWSSCCGSPINTTVFAACETASTFASDICAAFVHEEDIQGVGGILPGPEPCSATAYLDVRT